MHNVQPQESSTVRRMQRNATTLEVAAPMAVISYNKWMGGVDRGDQMRKYYQLRLKSRKFCKYIFWFLFDVSIVNAYVLYTHYSTSTCSNFKQFRLELAKSLISTYNSRKRAVPWYSHHLLPPPPTRVALRHFPIKHKTTSQKGVSRCWYCSHVRKPPRRKETAWYCTDCGLHLCHSGEADTDCFLRYHPTMISES